MFHCFTVKLHQVWSILAYFDSDLVEADEENRDPSLQDEAGEETTEAPEKAKPLRPLSNVELFVTRKKKLEERKQTIALLATSILENPQENVSVWTLNILSYLQRNGLLYNL